MAKGADQGANIIEQSPRVCLLSANGAFKELSPREKLYAHYLTRAAWHGTRIILRQVSSESIPIFDFILELYRVFSGEWKMLAAKAYVSMSELCSFLDFAAVFLGNIGNYFGQGDQKFVPKVTVETLEKLSSVSDVTSRLYKEIREAIIAPWPRGLGFPSDFAQSAYYPGALRISKAEIGNVSRIMEAHSIEPENTRVQKTMVEDELSYTILQSSIETGSEQHELERSASMRTTLVRGDHSRELYCISECLKKAREFAANSQQEAFIAKFQESFTTGDMEAYKESQRIWVKDTNPSIEVILGFIEPYRDPFGIRAEFEGLVAIVHKEETKLLADLAESSAKFVRRLPWAENQVENDGKGPFEKALFDVPDFTSLHTIAYASSIIFPGINLPNYNDIRQQVGFKNVMITNSMTAGTPLTEHMATLLEPSESATFIKHREATFYLWVVFHELLGHGTGKLLMEEEPGKFNFDMREPPINPLTGEPVESWYRYGQTWTGLFGDLATTVDECRAECVGAYLMSDMELVATFGYTERSEITGKDLEHNMYLQLGISGLRALENYMIEDKKWGQAHSRAHFAMFQSLLAAGDDFMKVSHDVSSGKLTVSMDRRKIPTHGKPALAKLLLRLHIYRCTADVKACREFYESITEPDEIFLKYRTSMLANQPARQVFVQPNTFLVDGKVILKEYSATVEGMLQSWAERMENLS